MWCDASEPVALYVIDCHSEMDESAVRGELLDGIELGPVRGQQREPGLRCRQEDEGVVQAFLALMPLEALGSRQRARDQARFGPDIWVGGQQSSRAKGTRRRRVEETLDAGIRSLPEPAILQSQRELSPASGQAVFDASTSAACQPLASSERSCDRISGTIMVGAVPHFRPQACGGTR